MTKSLKLCLLGFYLLVEDTRAACSLCAGEDAPDLSAVTKNGVACSELAGDAENLPDPPDPFCVGLQYIGFESCGCPTKPVVDGDVCNVCGDPSIGFNEDAELFNTMLPFYPDGTIDTCGQLNELANLVTSGCNFFENFAGQCQCSGTSITCPLCPDGSSVPDPNKVILNPLDPVFDPAFENPTCGFLESNAALLGPDNAAQCNATQSRYAFACGCPDTEPSCTLCADGEAPTKPRATIPGVGISCQDGEQVALAVDPDNCASLQAAAAEPCGCSGGSNGTDALCPLCEDGSSLPNTFQPVLGFTTCGDVAASFEDETDPTRCTAIQATVGVYCGCDNPIAEQGACRICDGLLPAPDLFVEAGDFDGACGDVEFLANSGELDCATAKESFGPGCCGVDPTPTSPPTDPPVIPTLDPTNSTSLIPSVVPSIHPSSVPSITPSLDSNSPSLVPSSGESRKPSGEPSTPAANSNSPSVMPYQCPLCEDGSSIPNPTFDVLEGETCTEAQTRFADTESNSTECTAIQATIGVYCGCQNPNATQSVCRICGDGVELPVPSFELDGFDGSCAEAELFASKGTITCNTARMAFGACCSATFPPTDAPGPTGAPTEPPASVPTEMGDLPQFPTSSGRASTRTATNGFAWLSIGIIFLVHIRN